MTVKDVEKFVQIVCYSGNKEESLYNVTIFRKKHSIFQPVMTQEKHISFTF